MRVIRDGEISAMKRCPRWGGLAPAFCFDAFPLREPDPSSLENAIDQL
jgi:hypothetical protein